MNKHHFTIMVIFLINSAYGNENTYVNVPCPIYKVGFERVSYMKGENLESTIKEVVISNKDNKIILKTTTKNKMYNVEQITTMMSNLFEYNGTIYVSGEEINNGGFKLKNKNIPDVPLCGKVPKIFEYRTTSTSIMASENMPLMRYIVKTKHIGYKTIKVKSGEFKTDVFQKSINIKVINKKDAALTKVVSTQYFMDKIGLIKQKNISAIIMPKNDLIAMPNIMKNIVTQELISYGISGQK